MKQLLGGLTLSFLARSILPESNAMSLSGEVGRWERGPMRARGVLSLDHSYLRFLLTSWTIVAMNKAGMRTMSEKFHNQGRPRESICVLHQTKENADGEVPTILSPV